MASNDEIFGQNDNLVKVFKNGCIYCGDKYSKHTTSNESGFHTIIFYENFSDHKVIASFEGPIVSGTEQPFVRQIIDNKRSARHMQNQCLDVLVQLLKQNNPDKSYKEDDFSYEQIYDKSIQEYIQTDSTIKIEPARLKLSYFEKLK